MQKNYIQVQKTARYFTIGELGKQTQYIWLIIHGYAQTAESFISQFKELGSNHFIIAPEGLNKFYSRGFAGSPVASWMTSLERESEIVDYCNYLETLVQTLKIDDYNHCKKIVLGFSQGVSTQTRFINNSSFLPDYLIMVAGEIAKEYQEVLPDKLASIKSLYLVGNEEKIVSEEKISAMQKLLEKANCSFETFNGKHEVNESTIAHVLAFTRKINSEF
jgi:predicted esterase